MTVDQEMEEGELAESLGPPALALAGSGRALHFLRLTWPGEARRRPADGRISVSRNSAPIPDVDKSVLVAGEDSSSLISAATVTSRLVVSWPFSIKSKLKKLTA